MGLPSGTFKATAAQFAYLPEILNFLIIYAYVFYLGLVAEPFFKGLIPMIEADGVRGSCSGG
jgi:hypothetical protein